MNSFLPEQADTGRHGKKLIVNKPVPARVMREHPHLDQLRRQAKELLEAFRSGGATAGAEVSAHYGEAGATVFALHDAQLVLARAYGFESWPKLKAYIKGVTAQAFRQAVRSGDLDAVRVMLKARPELANLKLSGYDDRAPPLTVLK